MKILGICGSIRKNSSNWFILKAAQNLFSQFEWSEIDLSQLPFFDPENQFSENTPAVVTKARELASRSDLIFISTPEYAHGVPGVLKNGLEWLFYEGTQKKPVALVIGATQGEYAQAQLIEILQTMDFVINEKNTFILKGARSKLSENGTFKNKTDELAFNTFCRQFI